ncbi:MAG TPA: PDR/VanB family oxidoreductase [Stellaceae bacterium]|nr:PDR/VanB family oxidoreductase [Stellaceae bacterium]
MGEIAVVVKEARQLTPAIRELVLGSADGAALPAWEPGAHIEIDVKLPDGTVEARAYSLIGGTVDRDDPPDRYRIAVERQPESRGGSRFLHDEVAVGATLSISPPKNEFPLHLHKADRVLVAGGIGVAPIYAMARALTRQGIPFELHYAGPAAEEMAYREELQRLAGDHAHFHYEGGHLDLDGVFGELGYPAEVYICGQRPFNQALATSALEHGLSRMQIMQQCFDPPLPPVPNDNIAFEVELRNSGITVEVPPEASILETLLSAGYHAQFYCGRGECGFCPLPVLETDGEIVHRDHYLQPEEKGEQLCICVSRLKTGTKLVLDA